MLTLGCQEQTSRPRILMKRLILAGLSLCAAVMPAAAGEPPHSRPAAAGVVQDFNPTNPNPHDYTPPTPVGRGHGNAYFGAGYVEFLYSGGGSRTPRLPPRRVYVGPLESEPYGNRRMQLRQGMSPRAGVYTALPEGSTLVPPEIRWPW
jgi:hypothetical protein